MIQKDTDIIFCLLLFLTDIMNNIMTNKINSIVWNFEKRKKKIHKKRKTIVKYILCIFIRKKKTKSHVEFIN